jgi:hypothetical protein
MVNAVVIETTGKIAYNSIILAISAMCIANRSLFTRAKIASTQFARNDSELYARKDEVVRKAWEVLLIRLGN